jgi:hypothetical protein
MRRGVIAPAAGPLRRGGGELIDFVPTDASAMRTSLTGARLGEFIDPTPTAAQRAARRMSLRRSLAYKSTTARQVMSGSAAIDINVKAPKGTTSGDGKDEAFRPIELKRDPQAPSTSVTSTFEE